MKILARLSLIHIVLTILALLIMLIGAIWFDRKFHHHYRIDFADWNLFIVYERTLALALLIFLAAQLLYLANIIAGIVVIRRNK